MRKNRNVRLNQLLQILLATVFLMSATLPGGARADGTDVFNVDDVTVEKNGVSVEEVDGLDTGDTLRLSYHWSIDNASEGLAGETLSINLPDEFSDVETSGSMASGGTVYGTYAVAAGVLTVVFNDIADAQSNVEGWIVLDLTLDVEQVRVDEPYTLNVPISGGQSVSFSLDFAPPEGLESVAKTGTLDAATGELIWTVDVNTDLAAAGAILVEDTLDGRLLPPRSTAVAVYQLDVFSDATVAIRSGAPLVPVTYEAVYGDPHGEDHELTFAIDASENPDGNQAFRIRYRTPVDPDLVDVTKSEVTYDNEARFGPASSQTDVTVQGGDILEKRAPSGVSANERTIQWEIRVNEPGYPLKDVRLRDVLPVGLTLLNPANVTVTRDADASVVGGVYQSYDEATRTLELDLGDLNGSHTVTIESHLTDAYLKTLSVGGGRFHELDFTNDAELTIAQNGTDVSVTDSATLQDLRMGKLLYKGAAKRIGYDAEKFIDWTVDVNLGQWDTTITEVLDVVSDGVYLPDPADVTVHELTISQSGSVSTGAQLSSPADYAVSVDPATRQMTVTFTAALDGAVRIAYPTRLLPSSYASDGQNFRAENEASLSYGGYTYSVDRGYRPDVNNLFSKSSTDVDYLEKRLDWELVVNPIREGLSEFLIEDRLSPELYMTQAQLDAVTGAVYAGSTPVDEADYTVSAYMVGGKIKGFDIDFIDTYEVNGARYSVAFSTYMDPDVHQDPDTLDYDNSATFSWGGASPGSVTRTAAPEIEQTYARPNGNKEGSIDPATKTITWTIHVNHLSKDVGAYAITDQIQSTEDADGFVSGQQLVADSIEVYPYTVDADGNITAGAKLDQSGLTAAGITITEDLAGNFFRVYFSDLTTPYQVRAVTELVGISSTSYENTVVSDAGDSYTATVPFDEGELFVDKEGSRDGDFVDWTITLNESRSTLTSLSLLDTMSPGLDLVEDSFEMYDADGSPMDFEDYFSLEVLPRSVLSDPLQFRLASLQTIDDLCTIEYRSEIDPEFLSSNTFENEVVFEGEKVVSGTRQTTKSIPHSILSSAGFATGEVGAIHVTKENPEGEPLAGAVFDVYRIKADGSEVFLGTVETDDAGRFELENLRYFTYRLVERATAEGYILPSGTDAETLIEVNDTVPVERTLVNQPLRSIRIVKRDSVRTDVYLANARFELTRADDPDFEWIVTSDGDGIALADDLTFGTYTVRETGAPSGYRLDQTPQTVTVDDSQMIFELVFDNERRPRNDSDAPPEEPEEETPEDPLPPEEDDPIETETTTDEDTPLDGVVDAPEDGEVDVVDEPDHGDLELEEDGGWTYTPDEGYTGPDRFTIRTTSPDGDVLDFVFEIEVEPVPLELPDLGVRTSQAALAAGWLALLILGGAWKRRESQAD